MSSWIVRRARVAWVLGFAVALVGSLPVLLLALRALLPGAHAAAGPLLDFVPEIPSPWLAESRLGMLLRKLAFIPAGLHGALLLALAGLGVMMLGKAIADGQGRILEADRMRREDALRRVRHYRESARVEPSIGDGSA